MFYMFIYILLMPLTFLTVLYKCNSNDGDDDRQPEKLKRLWIKQRKSWIFNLTVQLQNHLTLTLGQETLSYHR